MQYQYQKISAMAHRRQRASAKYARMSNDELKKDGNRQKDWRMLCWGDDYTNFADRWSLESNMGM